MPHVTRPAKQGSAAEAAGFRADTLAVQPVNTTPTIFVRPPPALDSSDLAMKVTVIGSGYVGLVTAACLADMGNERLLPRHRRRQGRHAEARARCRSTSPAWPHVVQPTPRPAGCASAPTRREAALHGKVQFIAVGTPPDSDGSADLQYVLAAARELGRHMDGYRVVVDKSTGAGRHGPRGARPRSPRS